MLYQNYLKRYLEVVYTPVEVGIFTIYYMIIFTIPGSSYLFRSAVYEITITNYAYDSCETYTGIGNDDHKCIECRKGYYKLENTNNCYKNIPTHYYLFRQERLDN